MSIGTLRGQSRKAKHVVSNCGGHATAEPSDQPHGGIGVLEGEKRSAQIFNGIESVPSEELLLVGLE